MLLCITRYILTHTDLEHYEPAYEQCQLRLRLCWSPVLTRTCQITCNTGIAFGSLGQYVNLVRCPVEPDVYLLDL